MRQSISQISRLLEKARGEQEAKLAKSFSDLRSLLEEQRRLGVGPTVAEEQRAGEAIRALHVLIRDWRDLISWANPQTGALSARQTRYIANLMSAAGFPAEDVDGIIERTGRRPVGRPPRARGLALAALEAKLGDPKFSWQRFANAHCPCGQPQHGLYCKERIRQSVIELQKLLRRVGVELP